MTFWEAPSDWKIDWSTQRENFSHVNQWIFLILPWALLATVFIFRKRLSGLSNKAKGRTYTTMGIIAISWELWFDLGGIISSSNPSHEVWVHFVDGFDFCRINMYILGSFLVIRKPEWVKWIAATALFGGYTTLIDHYHDRAAFHSLVTHAIILAAFPAIAITMNATNYKVKNLVQAHLFNWSLVAIMYTVNQYTGGVAGELTKDRMADNMMVGFAPWPFNVYLWMLSVMFLEWSYFTTYRVVHNKTYEVKNGVTFIQSFKNEWKAETKKYWITLLSVFGSAYVLLLITFVI